jgi:hypothetical protein
MSLFKRIFGNGGKESDKQVEKDIEQIKKGKISKIYPILKPGNWVGLQAGAIRQTIIGTQEEPQLVVGFGYDTPSNFVFLMPKDLDGKDPNKILNEAYSNLEDVQSHFEISEKLGGKVLTASGNDFSAEKILSKNHMMKAHELLKSEELIVSIPRRRCMMITSKSVDIETLNIFVALHKNAWEDDSYGNAQIMNALFVVINGQIDGLIPLN